MTKYCVCCGSLIPDNQRSKTCSMYYGDIDHGKDGYYREWAEGMERQAEEKKQQERQFEQQIREEKEE